MILILLFKACWYDKYIKEIVAAGKPYDHCPVATNAGFTAANAGLYSDWMAL